MVNIPGYELGDVLFSEEEISHRIKELGKQISEDYKGKNILVLGILKGSMVFMADLIRAIDGDVEIDFMQLSSYGDSMKSSGNVRILKDIDASPAGRNILIVDDIIDTGNTLKYLKEDYLQGRGAKSVRIATMLDKPSKRIAYVRSDYNGFQIGDKFIVGYGLDYSQKLRNLPYIAYLEKKED